jgi:GNAT superfamily N-acetyltransferase
VSGWSQADIARAEELRAALGISETAGVAEPFRGGFLCWDAPGSWANCAYAVGLEGEARPGDVERLVAFYADRGSPARIEIPPTIHESWVRDLAHAGFRVRRFENVFARELVAGEVYPAAAPPGLEIRRVDPADPVEVARYARIVASGFAGPEGATADEIALNERIARHPAVVAAVAWLDGEAVGAGTADVAPAGEPRVGGLFALTVLPPWRRRGIQQALVAWRLGALRDRGCAVATISSLPGVATERNARRQGFSLAYTKVQLERPRGQG